MGAFPKKHSIAFPLILILAVFAYLAFMVCVPKAQAAVPKLLNFQGKLTKNSDGTNVVNGNYSMQFKIYDSLSSGSLLWTETWENTGTSSQVSVVNGIFSVKLGTYTSLNSLDFSAGSLYLSVNFNSGSGYDGEMSPRKQLVSAPFALNANSAVGDGRLDLTSTATSSPVGKFTYNPAAGTTSPAVIISAGANVQGPALNVIQAGTGYAALFSGGNVGLGTATPASLLQVAGDIRLGVASTTQGQIIFQNSVNGFITTVRASSTQATNLTFVLPNNGGSAGQSILTDGSGGLYFGAASASLSGGLNGYITRWLSGSTVGTGVLMDNGTVAGVNATSSSYTFNLKGSAGVNPFQITSSSNTSLLVVNQNGNVGIGTTTPTALLALGTASNPGTLALAGGNSGLVTIQASTTAGDWTLTLPTNGGVSNQFLTTDGNGVASWQDIPLSGNLTYYFQDTASDVATYKKQLTAPFTPLTTLSTSGLASGNTVLQNWITSTSSPGLSFIPAGTFEMHVHAARTAGTKTAQILVQMWETDAAGADIAMIGQAPTSTALTIFNIEYRLYFTRANTYSMASINSRIAIRVYAVVSGSGTAPTVVLYYGDSSDAHVSLPSQTIDASNFVPYTGATTNLNLGAFGLYAGRIGVATTSMDDMFAVQGSGALNLFELYNSSGASKFVVASSGSVGIGTAVPGSLLQVAGDLRLGAASTTAGQIILQNASNGFTTTIRSSSTQVSNLTFVLPNSAGSVGQSILTDGSGGLYFGAASASLSGGLNGYITRWLSGSTVGTGVLMDNGTVAGVNATSSAATFTIRSNANTSPLNVTSSSGASLLSISALGNLGLGTTTADDALAVIGRGNNNLFEAYSSSSLSKFVITANGNTGIGTTTPSANLTVANLSGSQDALLVNQAGTGNIFRLQQSGTDKLVVNNSGTLTINGTDSSIVRTTGADFALGTVGSSLLNFNNGLEISDTVSGGIPNSGKGTITTAGQPTVTASAAGISSGALSITRPDGKYYVIMGAGATTASCGTAGTATNVYDSIAGTFTASTRCMSAAVGAGAVALPRPTGQYRILHGGGLTTSSLIDPTETLAPGGALAFTASASGTVAFLRPDSRYLVTNGGAATAQIYDPVGDTIAATAVTGSFTFGQGALVLPRLDGQALIVTGGATSTTQLYNPNAGAVSGIGPVGAFAVGPRLDGSQATGTCATNNLGSVGFRRSDGNFVILSKANVWAVYDPAANTITCNASGGPSTAMGDGAHAIPLQNGKKLIIVGGGSTDSFVYDPSDNSFTAHGTALTAITAGAHSIMRTDGTWQILVGGRTTTTNNYNTGLPMSDTNTVYTSEDIYNPNLNANSTFRWDGQMEAVYSSLRNNATNTAYSALQFFVRTAVRVGADCTTPLNSAVDYEIRNSGDLIHAVAGANCVRVKVQFNRPLPKRLIDERGTWVGTGRVVLRLDYVTPTLFSWSVDNSVVLRKTSFDFTSPNSTADVPNTGPGALTAGAPTSGGSCTPGTHAYYVTTVVEGVESQLGTKSSVITCILTTGQTVPLSAVPLGPTGTTARKIYRTVANDIGTPKLLTTLADNTTTVFSDTVADGSLGADFTIGEASGPTLTRGEGTRVETTNGQLYLPYGRPAPTTMNGATGFYQGVVSGAHPLLATTTTDGTFVMALDNKTFMVILAGTTTPALYDPATQTFTSQTGAGNILTLNNSTNPGAGAFALKREDGKFFLYLGTGSRTATCNTAGTATNIYDPNAASGGRFVDGPCLTAAGGMGAFGLLNADGTFTIVHAGGVGTTTIYNPVTNTTMNGPLTGASVMNCGAWGVPMGMPFNNQYKVYIGQAPGGAATAVALNYNAVTKVFTTGTSLTTASGCGSMAVQRADGWWLILMGNGLTTTNIMNPYSGVTIAGPAMSAAVGRGSNVIPRADGTFLIIHGNSVTTTTVYFPWGGTFGQGVGIGSAAAGPALVNASGNGGLSFQRPDGKWVIISGASTGSTTPSNKTNLYDAGWYPDGQYLSEQMNVPALAAGSTLEWQQTQDNYVRLEVRYASSQAALSTANWVSVGSPGQSIGNSGGETWVQVEVNFRREFPTFCNNLNGAYASGGGQAYCYRQISLPTINQYQITNGMDIINLQNNGLSVFRVTSNGGIYSSSNGGFYSGGADLAENYTSTQKLAKAEVVIGDPNNPKGVLRSTTSYQSSIVGVVSTAPGFVAGSYTEDSYPIALIGRVPVKVSTENGMIKSGDYLTSASLPGYAMKATRAGRVLGMALEDLDTNKLENCPAGSFSFPGQRQCGTVTVFVNLINYNGQSVELAMAEAVSRSQTSAASSTESGLAAMDGFEASALTAPNVLIQTAGDTTQDQRILDFLVQLKAAQESSAMVQMSEVFTDRLSAVMEVISPKVTTETLHAREIRADKIYAKQIEGLEIWTEQLSSLSRQISDLGFVVSASSTAPSGILETLASSTPPVSSTTPVLAPKPGLTFMSDIKMLGGLKVDSLGSVQDVFSLTSDTLFIGRPYFTTDTAGFAVVVKGTRSVEVVFDRAYLEQPVVNATISLSTSTPEKNIAESLADSLFDQDIRYMVKSKSAAGFTIVLNKPAPADVEFSWMALAVRSAKTFSSKAQNESAPIQQAAAAEPVPAAPASSTPVSQPEGNDPSAVDAVTDLPQPVLETAASSTEAGVANESPAPTQPEAVLGASNEPAADMPPALEPLQ